MKMIKMHLIKILFQLGFKNNIYEDIFKLLLYNVNLFHRIEWLSKSS